MMNDRRFFNLLLLVLQVVQSTPFATEEKHSTLIEDTRRYGRDEWTSLELPRKIEKYFDEDRHLVTGDFYGSCSNILDVYESTEYDDAHMPSCACYQYEDGEIFLECDLQDDSCQDLVEPQGNQTQVCTSTIEYFFFSEDDGDVKTKATCTFCSHEDQDEQELCSDNVREICTFVTFQYDKEDHLVDEPVSCYLKEFNFTSKIDECDECRICTRSDPTSGDVLFGIEHDCFDIGTASSCDTSQWAQLNNFAQKPGIEIAKEITIDDGKYREICLSSSEFAASEALYEMVSYDDDLAKICDCESRYNEYEASITCDLFDPSCFANECVNITEVFHFNYQGQLTSKWTLSSENIDFLFTEVLFDMEGGFPTECGVIGRHAPDEDLFTCTNCEPCLTDGSATNGQQEMGIKFNCFNTSTNGDCIAIDGHGQYNFAQNGGADNFFNASSPIPETEANSLPTTEYYPTKCDDKCYKVLLTLVIILGCFVASGLIFLAYRHYNNRESLVTTKNDSEQRSVVMLTDRETLETTSTSGLTSSPTSDQGDVNNESNSFIQSSTSTIAVDGMSDVQFV